MVNLEMFGTGILRIKNNCKKLVNTLTFAGIVKTYQVMRSYVKIQQVIISYRT